MTRATLALLIGCGAARDPRAPTESVGAGDRVLVGGTVLGIGPADLVIRDGTIAAIGEGDPSLPQVSIAGKCVSMAFIDSHVHLTYLPEAEAMAAGGVVAAVDLAAPLASLGAEPGPVELRAAGPMITAVGGYPTTSWGAGGYGLEVAGPQAAADATNALIDAGAALIKVPITAEPTLTEAELRAVVDTAHARDRKVAVHALSETYVALGATVGADVLAHTPVYYVTDETIALWSGRAVISTLGAFGATDAAIDNLRRLREAGATVLYGTDFGNARTPGIDTYELSLLARAGLDPAQIRAAGTSDPATYWGFEGLGTVAVGARDALWIGPCDCAWCDIP